MPPSSSAPPQQRMSDTAAGKPLVGEEAQEDKGCLQTFCPCLPDSVSQGMASMELGKMGGGGGGGSKKKKTPKKAVKKGEDSDPADLLLDEDDGEFDEIGFDTLDDIFGKCGGFMGSVIEMNNGMLTVRDRVMEAAAQLYDKAVMWEIKIERGELQFEMHEWDAKDEDTLVVAVGKGQKDMEIRRQATWDALQPGTQTAIMTANKDLGELIQSKAKVPELQFRVENRRVIFATNTIQAAKKAKKAIAEQQGDLATFNQSFAHARWVTLKESIQGGLDLHRALDKVKEKLKSTIGGELRESFSLNMDTFAENGEFSLEYSFGELDSSSLPRKLKDCIDALFDENEDDQGLVPFLSSKTPAVYEALMETTTLIDSSAQLIEDFQNPSKLQEVCSDKSMMEIARMPGKIAGNSGKMKALPPTIKGVIETIKFVVEEIRASAQDGPMGATKASG